MEISACGQRFALALGDTEIDAFAFIPEFGSVGEASVIGSEVDCGGLSIDFDSPGFGNAVTATTKSCLVSVDIRDLNGGFLSGKIAGEKKSEHKFYLRLQDVCRLRLVGVNEILLPQQLELVDLRFPGFDDLFGCFALLKVGF